MESETRAEGQRLLEKQLLDIYADVNRKWAETKSHLFEGQCGFSVLGSRPRFAPELLIIGENPGFSETDRKIGKPHIQSHWPKTSYIEEAALEDKEVFRDRLLRIFRGAGLETVLRDAAKTDFLFFKSNSLRGSHNLSWSKIDRTLASELARFSEERLRRIVDWMKPQTIMVAGNPAFERHASNVQRQVLAADGKRRLIATGELFGYDAFAILHPSAHWRCGDEQNAAKWLREYFPKVAGGGEKHG